MDDLHYTQMFQPMGEKKLSLTLNGGLAREGVRETLGA